MALGIFIDSLPFSLSFSVFVSVNVCVRVCVYMHECVYVYWVEILAKFQ